MRKQKRYRLIRLFAVLTIVTGGIIATAPRALAAPRPVRVSAAASWVDTGITVGKGQDVYMK